MLCKTIVVFLISLLQVFPLQVLSLSLCSFCFWPQGSWGVEYYLWTRFSIQTIQSAVGSFSCCQVYTSLCIFHTRCLAGGCWLGLYAVHMLFLNSIGNWWQTQTLQLATSILLVWHHVSHFDKLLIVDLLNYFIIQYNSYAIWQYCILLRVLSH